MKPDALSVAAIACYEAPLERAMVNAMNDGLTVDEHRRG